MKRLHFPFGHNKTHTFGDLRAFERNLSASRQVDPVLSKAVRVLPASEARKWKIREETYPIKLLADHKTYKDDATFRLMPFGSPAVDALIDTGEEKFDLQITIADPVWARENGGYSNRLMMEALNRYDVVVGSGPFRRDGDEIVCDEAVKDQASRADACQRGLVSALSSKLRKGVVASRLLVHARGYEIHIVDEGLKPVVTAAVGESEGAFGSRAPFDVMYFVTQNELVEIQM